MQLIKASEHLPSVGIYHAFYNGDHVIFQVHDGGFRVINYHGEKDDAPKLYLIKWLDESNSGSVSKARGCPCLVLDEPCHPNCTCKNGLYSGGCLYCAKYGNLEQRKEAAEKIKHALTNASKVEQEEDQELWKEFFYILFGDSILPAGLNTEKATTQFTIKRK